MSESSQPAQVGSHAQLAPERAAFEAFAEDWIGRSMAQLVAGGTWGLGRDSFAWACWMRAAAVQREQCAAIAESWATDETATTCANVAAAIRGA